MTLFEIANSLYRDLTEQFANLFLKVILETKSNPFLMSTPEPSEPKLAFINFAHILEFHSITIESMHEVSVQLNRIPFVFGPWLT